MFKINAVGVTWKIKVVAATYGSHFGMIVCAATGKQVAGSHFAAKGIITKDGYVICDYVDSKEMTHAGTIVCSVSQLVRDARALVTHCNLHEVEREAFYTKLNEWIGHDESGHGLGLIPNT